MHLKSLAIALLLSSLSLLGSDSTAAGQPPGETPNRGLPAAAEPPAAAAGDARGGHDSDAELLRQLAELRRRRDALNDEIAQLEARLDGRPLVQLDIRVIQIDWPRLRQSGLPLLSLQQLCGQPCPAEMVLSDDTVPGMLDLVCRQRVARVLSDGPRLAPAGAAFRVPLDQPAAGLPPRLVAEPDAPAALRVACQLMEDPGKIRCGFAVDGQAAAPRTAQELPLGATVLVVAANEPAEDPERSVLVLVTPVCVRRPAASGP